MRPCEAQWIHYRALHYQALVKPSSVLLLVQAAGKGIQELVSHMVLYRNLAFDKNWNGKRNGTLGTGDSPARVGRVCSTSWPSSPANESACKTLSLVRAGMWRQAQLIKLSEIWKKSISYAAEGSPRGVHPHSKGRVPTFWLREYLKNNVQSAAIREVFAIKHSLMQPCLLGFLLVFFLPWYFLFLSLFLCGLLCPFKH